MDCKTARQLLDYLRPHAGELDAAETTALEEHLSSCPECDGVAGAERRLDDALGQAMRHVEVPDRLRARILARLAAERSDQHRRRYGHFVRVAAAAAVLIASFITYAWWAHRPTVVDEYALGDYWTQVKGDKFSPPDAEELRGRFKRMGVEAAPPDKFRYNYLASYGLGDFLGQQVPQMVFVREAAAGAGSAQAQVLILSSQQFNLEHLAGEWHSEDGYPYRVEAVKDANLRQVYVIFHTGDDFNWLERRDEEPAL